MSKRSSGKAAPASAAVAPRPPKKVGTMALWVCTPFGILMPGLRPAHTYDAAADNRDLQVRAREKDYLDRFREMYCPELGESLHFDQDYPWKAYVTREDLARAMARMVLDTDSEVFKPLVDREKGLKSKLAGKLHACYNAMWATHLRYGDGTSSYDMPFSKYPAKAGSWKPADWPLDGLTTSSIPQAPAYTPLYADRERCARDGHWFTMDEDQCSDCGAPRPSSWRSGDAPVFPGFEDYAEGNAVDRDSGWLEDLEDEDVDPGECPGCGANSGHKSWCRFRAAAEAV